MSGMIFVLALFFGAVALWAGLHLAGIFRKPAPPPPPRIIAPSPTDPSGALLMPQRGRDGPRPGQRGF